MADRPDAGRPAVFLDRDGVLNRAIVRDGSPFPPRGVGELEVLPGVPEACAAMKSAGLLLVVVTNQPDIARGSLSLGDLAAIHEALLTRISVDEVFVCPHDDHDECTCRKPEAGLLRQAAARFGISLDRSVMVGDRWRDVEAGRRAGCQTVFLDAGYEERKPEAPDLVAKSLPDALPWILQACARGEELSG